MKKQTQKERAREIFTLYSQGVSLEEVGKVHDITRERVRQILTHFFPEKYKKQKQKNQHIYGEKRITNRKQITCQNCQTSFIGARSRKYCSYACFRMNAPSLRNIYPDWVGERRIHKGNFTEDEWRIINNIRTKHYYHTHKEEQRKKRVEWMRKNKEKQSIFLKRCNERKKFGRAITPLLDPKNMDAIKL